MKRSRAIAFLALALGCHGEDAPIGLDEPIRVAGGTFQEGTLPGSPPLTDEEVAAGAAPQGTRVTIVESVGTIVVPGQTGKGLLGRATDDGSSVGVALEGHGTGYWTVPLGPPDPAVPGELTWGFSLDFGHEAPTGLHRLLFAAIDDRGEAGTQVALPLCIRPELPDNLHACDPSQPLPGAVVALEWDANVDLDLVVFTPEGKRVDPKHPTSAPLDDKGKLAPRPGDGTFESDGLQGCKIGPRREHLVFQEKPLPGIYYVFVSLFDACDQPAVRFTTSLHLPEGEPPVQTEVLRASGQLLKDQVDGGATLGTFMAEFAIQ